MKKVLMLLTVTLLSAVLSGCFQVEQVITLLPDGSGTIEETMMISRKIADSMAAFAGGMAEQGDTAAPTPPPSFFKDEEIQKRAEGFGPDTRFIKMERLKNPQFEGYKAVYSFKNINNLRIDAPAGGMSGQAGAGNGAPVKATEFIFKAGKNATLLVKHHAAAAPAVKEPVQGAEPAAQPGSGDLEMLRQMFAGMRIATTLVIKGNVVESNATHRSGTAITLAEIDFGKILDKPELLAKMAALPPGDQAAAMEMIKSFPGMKIDMNDEMRVVFK